MIHELKKETHMLNHKGFINPQTNKCDYSGSGSEGRAVPMEFVSGLDCDL